MKTVLGVDGGNSKTDVVVADELGNVLGRVRGPGCSPDALGTDGSLAVLAPLVSTVRELSGLQDGHVFDVAVLMLAGVDREDQEAEMVRGLAPLRLAHELVVTNDTFAVLQAGSADGWGVAVVCGAGLNAVGVTPDGRVGRYQALGELSGDWGGGDSMGLAALGAAIRGEDGRGPATLLTQRLSQHFQLPNPQAVAAAIHEGRLGEKVLVDCAPLVFECAAAGDVPSQQIVDRVGDEVAVMAVAMLRRLGLDHGRADVVLGGGIIQSGYQPLVDRATSAIRRAVPQAVTHVLDVPPIVGCGRQALRMMHLPSDQIDSAVARLASALVADISA